ncbi:MAG: hypothetical protein KDI68_04965 [Gammaproteobacteria bacterium]|nr:hypothetical protein [Gammaproteobacteria bacterium]
MKFSQLQIGQRFRYRDRTYTKSGPLQAIAAGSSSAEMIMRAAMIEVVEGDDTSEKVASSLQPLRDALGDYHRIVQQCSGTEAAPLREQLDHAYRRLIGELERLERA